MQSHTTQFLYSDPHTLLGLVLPPYVIVPQPYRYVTSHQTVDSNNVCFVVGDRPSDRQYSLFFPHQSPTRPFLESGHRSRSPMFKPLYDFHSEHFLPPHPPLIWPSVRLLPSFSQKKKTPFPASSVSEKAKWGCRGEWRKSGRSDAGAVNYETWVVRDVCSFLHVSEAILLVLVLRKIYRQTPVYLFLKTLSSRTRQAWYGTK